MSSAYALYNKGDNCPPCLIPFEQWNVIDNELAHHTINSSSLYQKINNFTICNGTFLSNSFFARVQWLTIKCLFCIMKAHVYRCVLIMVKIYSLLECKYGHFCTMCLLETKLAVCSPQVCGELRQQDLLKYLGESCGNCNWPVIVNICWIFRFALQ